jgi:DNA-binding GntR family transcriptional regulator
MAPTAGGYVAVADTLRLQIATGATGSDGWLPSEAELMSTFGTARTTVRRALKVLESEGLIRSQQGRGWMVHREGTPTGRLHEWVAGEIRAQITQRTWPPGSRLPSEKELAVIHRASRGAVRRALLDLEIEGLIEIRRGVGRFIVGPPSSAS